jgi:hypothetical protein
MISDTVTLMMIVSAFVSVTLLIIVLVHFKDSYFEDPEKSSNFPLFDSPQDLQNAKELEEKRKK